MNGPLRNDVEQAIEKLENANEHAKEADEPGIAEMLGQATELAAIARDDEQIPVGVGTGDGTLLVCPECDGHNVRTDEIGHSPPSYPDLYRLCACRDCGTTWNVVYRPVEANEVEVPASAGGA